MLMRKCFLELFLFPAFVIRLIRIDKGLIIAMAINIMGDECDDLFTFSLAFKIKQKE